MPRVVLPPSGPQAWGPGTKGIEELAGDSSGTLGATLSWSQTAHSGHWLCSWCCARRT